MRRDILTDAFRIHRQHPDDAVRSSNVIDDTVSAALTSAGSRPTQFPDPARAWDDRATVGIRDKGELERRVLIVRQLVGHQLRKEAGFDETEHMGIIRQCRSTSSRCDLKKREI
jgi:hypothetical protein